MVAEAIKKYRQDEGVKVDQNIPSSGGSFLLKELESSSLLQYKSSTDKFTVGFITKEIVMENIRATNAFKYSADKDAVGTRWRKAKCSVEYLLQLQDYHQM